MYIPQSFAERDLPTLHAYMEANPLGALITSTEANGLYATHLPLVLDRTAGEMGTLIGHFSRANPHGRDLSIDGKEAMVIFTGPDAYITPQWYATKRETGKAVPTWNYIAVHTYGQLRLSEDPEFAITRIEGKWKMSQNRTAADVEGVIHGLSASDNPRDHEVAAIVRERRPTNA